MKNLACGLETTALIGQVVAHEQRTQSTTNSVFSTALKRVNLWFERSESRRQLARLDDQLLRDIGITRHQARIEANKPFWQP